MARKKKQPTGEQSRGPMDAATAGARAGEQGPRTVDAEPTRPDPQRIAARAYQLYLERGGTDGQAMDDWLAAEGELSGGRRD
jgi:hypothetical protein